MGGGYAEDSPPTAPRPAPTFEELKTALLALFQGRDLQSLSLKAMRRELETRLGFAEGGLDNRRDELKYLAQTWQELDELAKHGVSWHDVDEAFYLTDLTDGSSRMTSS